MINQSHMATVSPSSFLSNYIRKLYVTKGSIERRSTVGKVGHTIVRKFWSPSVVDCRKQQWRSYVPVNWKLAPNPWRKPWRFSAIKSGTSTASFFITASFGSRFSWTAQSLMCEACTRTAPKISTSWLTSRRRFFSKKSWRPFQMWKSFIPRRRGCLGEECGQSASTSKGRHGKKSCRTIVFAHETTISEDFRNLHDGISGHVRSQ